MLQSYEILNKYKDKLELHLIKKDGCWDWIGATVSGYGVLNIGTKNILAHRLSYILNISDELQGLNVLHKCDNRRCCNPEHLFLGTHKDNTRDMVLKGRAKGNGKLTPLQIQAIRADNRKQAEISKEYGITRIQIWRIKSHKVWKFI